MKKEYLLIGIVISSAIAFAACSAVKTNETPISIDPIETQYAQYSPSVTGIASTRIPRIKQPEFAQRAKMAFGLYSIGIPEGATIEEKRNPVLFQESYEVKNPKIKIATNFAPLDSYEDTAHRRFNSMVSYFYVLLDPSEYSETPSKEEFLENGARLKWQLMKSGSSRCIIFEAFSEQYGYNFAIYSSAPAVSDEVLIDMMYSFQYDKAIEDNTINLKQMKYEDGSFVSVDNALRIKLNAEWNECPQFMIEGSVFGLEWNNGKSLIQLFRYDKADAENQLDAFDYHINQLKQMSSYSNAIWGDRQTIHLENLDNIEAYVVEVDSNNEQPVISQNICFMYKGYCYIGMFMWIKPLDAEKRAEMEAAIHSLSPNE